MWRAWAATEFWTTRLNRVPDPLRTIASLRPMTQCGPPRYELDAGPLRAGLYVGPLRYRHVHAERTTEAAEAGAKTARAGRGAAQPPAVVTGRDGRHGRVVPRSGGRRRGAD